MSINYDKLFALLKSKGINKTSLANKIGISSKTLAKLSNGEYVSMKIIESICNVLDCTPSDVLVFSRALPKSEILRVLQEEKEMNLKGGSYHLTQIKLTYNSNHIEGSSMTEEQTRYIYETNTIGIASSGSANIDDIIETINHFRCIDYCLDHAEDTLSVEFIKAIHGKLKASTSESRKDWFAVGEYKLKPNFVGDCKTSAPSAVAGAMSELISSYNQNNNPTIDKIIAFHHDFECIHPFQDGNGRVGRLIAFKECLKHDIMPFIIDDSIKMFYYRGLKEWNNDRQYLLDTCKSGQDKYAELINYFLT